MNSVNTAPLPPKTVRSIDPNYIREDFLDLAEIDVFSLKIANLWLLTANLRRSLALRRYQWCANRDKIPAT